MHAIDSPLIPALALRLLLGSDAVHAVEQADTAKIEADRKWRSLSVSTDFVTGT